jgi:hypothetical protein
LFFEAAKIRVIRCEATIPLIIGYEKVLPLLLLFGDSSHFYGPVINVYYFSAILTAFASYGLRIEHQRIPGSVRPS